MNATERILIIPLDDDSQETIICETSDSSRENSLRQSHRTYSKLALNEKTNIECDKNSSNSSPNQFCENMRNISASDYGYLSDFDEEHRCFFSGSIHGFKCHLRDCEFTTIFENTYNDHFKNHVPYRLGQEIPQYWKPFFDEYVEQESRK
jgi:hypothetical protein